MPGRHRLPVCDEHVIRYQEDKTATGTTRIGRNRGDGRYVIEQNSLLCGQTQSKGGMS